MNRISKKIAFKLIGLISGVLLLLTACNPSRIPLHVSASADNDLVKVLQNQKNIALILHNNPMEAAQKAKEGEALLILADNYPGTTVKLDAPFFQLIEEKGLRTYLEYPSFIPGLDIPEESINTQLERGVITGSFFGEQLQAMSILGINDCYVLPVKVDSPLIVLAKVAGFDKAEYGIADVETYPLLFEKDNMLVAMTKLSNFKTGRYGPNDSWEKVWRSILSWTTGSVINKFSDWPSDVSPMYTKDEPLPLDAKAISVKKGVQWFYNGKFFIHPSWKEMWLKYQGNGKTPYGPPVSQKLPNGDGSLGLLEGHASKIYYDGSQQYRYWVRADVQGESAFALSAAGKFLNEKEYGERSEKLIDYMFYNSNLRAGAKNDKDSDSYGLIGWSVTHPERFFGDDNARAILGILGTSAYMNTNKWDKEIIEAILANFRTTGKYGFRGGEINEKDIIKLGWKYYNTRDIVNPAPHFESWMWALYLWLYEKTGYEPLLTKTKIAIRMTMEAYPDKWVWTNGIQQERARMVLPLAWLVRVEDTEEHRRWLDIIVQKLIENQVESGAIREELGAGESNYGRTTSNKEYGLHEATLMFDNGDPVSDMLYTSNFAFFSLNEAAHATGNKQYEEAVAKLSDFLIRIQVKSDKHKDLDGAWFRAFEYNRWEYWASNADSGWGAWGTLAGWTQSWIVATQVLTAQNQNFWDLTKDSAVKNYVQPTIDLMFKEKQ